MRGGAWRYEPGYLRAAARLWSEPGTRNADIGFRVARALD
ncbi:SUMF1/EgtB/PvdO family nonheme iron enzyme [Thiohalocapsa sp. ML1]